MEDFESVHANPQRNLMMNSCLRKSSTAAVVVCQLIAVAAVASFLLRFGRAFAGSSDAADCERAISMMAGHLSRVSSSSRSCFPMTN